MSGMKVAIFGANGKTGRHVVEQALERGHEVAAFVYKNPLTIEHQCLAQYQGDATDFDDVQAALTDCEAVVSVLGHSPQTLRHKPTMHRDSTRNIVTAMEARSIKRLVSLTGTGVRQKGDNPGLIDRALNTGLSLVAERMVADGRAHAQIIQNSQLDWVVVRALKLQNGPKTGRYSASAHTVGGMKTTINRGDVAAFMLDNIETDDYLRQMPVVHRV